MIALSPEGLFALLGDMTVAEATKRLAAAGLRVAGRCPRPVSKKEGLS